MTHGGLVLDGGFGRFWGFPMTDSGYRPPSSFYRIDARLLMRDF